MAQDALGRCFNLIPTAADTPWLNMRGCSGVTYLCVGANAETFTLAQATDVAGTGAATLSTVTRYYKNTAAAGATTWVREPTSGEQAASGVITTTTAHPVAVFTVSGTELSDGFDFLRVTSSSTGTVVAITHDLTVKRAPENLPAVAV